MIPILLLSLIMTEPDLKDINDLRDFAGHWMRYEVPYSILEYRYTEPKGVTPSILLRIRTTDPNCTVEEITYRPVNYFEFLALAQNWKGDPNYQPPPEPNVLENLSENNEPNGLNDPNILLLLNAFLQQIGKEDPNG